MKNFIVRTITAVFFVAAIVSCFLRAEAMVLLFALVTGLTVWEFTGLVNDRDNITVNRIICTVAGVYFFFAMAAYNSGITAASIFIPYLVTLIYLMVAELYLKHPDPVGDWAYTMMSQLYIALPLLVAQRAGASSLAPRVSTMCGHSPSPSLSSFGSTIRVPISAVRCSADTSSSPASHRVSHGKVASVAASS